MKKNQEMYNYFAKQEKAKKEIKKSEAIASDLIKWMTSINKDNV